MKQCPRCNQTYSDDQLNFCLDDGELLRGFEPQRPQTLYADDAPPTVVLNEARATSPANWPASAQPGSPVRWQQAGMPQPQFGQYSLPFSPSQTLAVVSLGLGIGSMTIGWCCSMGLLLSPAALITGFIALSQIKKHPAAYGGRGLAIGGIVTAAVFLSIYLLFIVIYGAAIIGSGLK